MKEVVIVSAVRTPIGKFMGGLSKLGAVELGAIAVQEAIKRAGISAEQVQDVTAGVVYKAALKGNPARQVSIKVGVPVTSGATTVDQQCASAMRAFEIASQGIMLGKSDISVAFGVESMSNVPHMLVGSRNGYRMGDVKVVDGLTHDALVCAVYGKHMGFTAQNLADQYGISRQEQDELAALSHARAVAAQKAGVFDKEIVPVTIAGKKGDIVISKDECPSENSTVEALSKLRAVFGETITAGNASSINDGAAAVVLMSAEKAEELGIKPIAKLRSTATLGVAPEVMGIGPAFAIPKALDYAGLTMDDIGYYEINEAFAAQFLACNRELKLPMDKVNANGSGISLGHPVGCTGIRIIVSLLHELERRGEKYGCASLCVGGGPAMATIVEML